MGGGWGGVGRGGVGRGGVGGDWSSVQFVMVDCFKDGHEFKFGYWKFFK